MLDTTQRYRIAVSENVSLTNVQKLLSISVLTILSLAAVLQRNMSIYPRPLILFGLLGLAAALIFALAIHTPPSTGMQLLGSYLLVLLVSFYIRASGVLGLAAAGRDTFLWASASADWTAAAHIVGSGMYSSSPFFILELVLGQVVIDTSVPYGISVYAAGGITIAAATLFPLMLAPIAVEITGRQRDGLLAALFGAFFPLFLRSSTLLQAEHLAVVWFACTILLLYKLYYAPQRRWQVLATAYLLLAPFLHFFYGGIIIGIVLSAAAGIFLFERYILSGRTRPARFAFILVLPAVVYLGYHLLFGAWGFQVVGVLMSAVSITLPSSPIALIVPSSGAAAASVGGGSSGPVATLIKIIPFFVVLLVAAIGALGVIVGGERFSLNLPLYAVSVNLAALTLFLLIAQLGYNLHFRMFYFVGVVVCIFAAVGVSFLDQLRTVPLAAIRAVLVIAFLIFAVTSPITPFGNNFDSPLSDSQFATPEDEYAQLSSSFDFAGKQGISSGHHWPPAALPAGDSGGTELTVRTTCYSNESRVWSSGWALCR